MHCGIPESMRTNNNGPFSNMADESNATGQYLTTTGTKRRGRYLSYLSNPAEKVPRTSHHRIQQSNNSDHSSEHSDLGEFSSLCEETEDDQQEQLTEDDQAESNEHSDLGEFALS